MKLRKLFAAGLALVMTLAMAAPAFAADDASITIDPTTPAAGSSTGETYTAYKIFDASFEGDSNKPGSVSYTIDASNPFFNAVKEFKVEGADAFKLTQLNGGSTYIVEKIKDYDAAALATALNAVTGKVAAATANVGADGKFTIEGLEKGYYMVTSSLGTKIIVETLGKTEVDTKNEYPTLTKTVDKPTADYGETVTYTIAVKIPATAAGQIVVHDSLASTLTYEGMTAVTGVTKQDSTCNACSFEFVLSEECVAANLDKTVEIVYTAKLNGNVATATAHDNSAWLTYAAYTSAKETVSVKTFEINVWKYTEKEGVKTGLPGAGFVLKNAAGKYYAIDADGNVSWVDGIANATERVSADDGKMDAFKGLANGTYTLVEKTVPTNYNPAQNVDITVENANPGQVEVLNQTGIALPSTGGMGTTLFYIVGGLMVVCAGVVLVTKKRMGNK